MKKKNLFLCVLLLNIFTFLHAESVITTTYYYNDFGNAENATSCSSMTYANTANASYTEEGALKIDLTNVSQYNVVLNIEFAFLLDLSNGASIEVEGKVEDVLLKTDGSPTSPGLYIQLEDNTGKRTEGNSATFRYTPETSFSGAVRNLASVPNGIDLTKIKKLRVTLGTASLQSGYFHIRKIKLGVLVSEEVPTSILTSRSFLNEFESADISDENQTTTFSSVTGTQADGVLDIHATGTLGTWKDFYVTTFATPIDLSDPDHHKLSLKFTIEDLVNPETGNKLGFRILDADGTIKILEPVLKPGTYDTTFVFTNTYSEKGTVEGFDFTKVNRIQISTRGAAMAGPGHIKLDRLLVGANIIPVNIAFNSFTPAGGLIIDIVPMAPQMDLNSFEFKDYVTGEPLTDITATLQNGGARFKFTGFPASGSGKYSLTLNDPLYYCKRTLIFSEEGMLTQGTAKVLAVLPDSITVRFEQPVNFTKEHFIVKKVETNELIPVQDIKKAYGGLEYYLYTTLEEATEYTLEIAAPGYTFGAPIPIRVGFNPLYPTVNWENIVGTMTAAHWGVNDNGPGMASVNTTMERFFDRVEPGVIRRHSSGFLNSWVDNEKGTWNIEKIETELANSKETYKHSKVMLCLDAQPTFISATLPLTEAQEDQLAALFAQLPHIVDSLGYHADMYEFLNEKEGAYADDRAAYWRMLNKIAVAMKTANPGIKVGGPAESWPTLYGGFIDNCGANMDFVSFHLYNGGPGQTPAGAMTKDNVTGKANAAGNVARYVKTKGLNLETYLDEYNLQYVWTPYEPMHHNHIGAGWMASFIKNVALNGVTGLNVWNTQDGAYGLNYNTAPANLFLMSKKHLRGGIAESSEPENKVELIPILAADGSKSILFVNYLDEKVTIVDAKALIGGDLSTIRGLRLDGTTLVAGTEYTTEALPTVPTDLGLNPYGMVLLTNAPADPISPPVDLKTVYKLEKEIGLTWSCNHISRQGFRISVNDEPVEDFKATLDTAYILKNLEPNTTYKITVATINEYGEVFPAGETNITVTTRKMPLKINDRTTGDGLHQWNFDKNWAASVANGRYNNDLTRAKAPVSTATIRFKGHTVAFFGSTTEKSKLVKIYVDDVLKKTLPGTTFGSTCYVDTLTDAEHTLKIEADATYSIDRLDVFGSMFEDITVAPAKVQEPDVLARTNVISLTWAAPEHVSGIQYYRILTTTPDSVRTDTVYSPEFTITGLEENVAYPVVIEAYDPCGNVSVGDEMALSTIEKQSVEIAKLVGTITLDGVADEAGWEKAQRLNIANSRQSAMPEAANLSGYFKALWATQYLYIYIHVTDDVRVERTDTLSELNENDGFELYLDGLNNKSGPYSTKDASIRALYSPNLYEEYSGVSAMTYKVADTDDGYGVELYYRLADLGMVPGAVGKELGLDIHLNDNDKTNDVGLDNKLTWQPGSESAALNMALLGDMIFVNELSNTAIPVVPAGGNTPVIYPNPVVDHLNLSINAESFDLRIYDAAGTPVGVYRNERSIDVSGLPSGLYFVRALLPEGEVYNIKFIKK